MNAAATVTEAIARICKLDRISWTERTAYNVLHIWQEPILAVLSLYTDKDWKRCLWKGDPQSLIVRNLICERHF